MSDLSEKIDVLQLASGVKEEWINFIAAHVDNYVVRVIVQETTSRWHHHARGDELFLVLQGEYAIDLEDRTIELGPGQMFTVHKSLTIERGRFGVRSSSVSNRRPIISSAQPGD